MPISQPLVGGDYGSLQALYVVIVFSNRMQSYAILHHPKLYPLLTRADTEGSQINPLFSTKTIRTPECEFSFQQICNTRRTIHCRGVSCEIIHAAGQLFSGTPHSLWPRKWNADTMCKTAWSPQKPFSSTLCMLM